MKSEGGKTKLQSETILCMKNLVVKKELNSLNKKSEKIKSQIETFMAKIQKGSRTLVKMENA